MNTKLIKCNFVKVIITSDTKFTLESDLTSQNLLN